MAYPKLSSPLRSSSNRQSLEGQVFVSAAYPIETEHSFEVNRKWCHMWCQYRKIPRTQVLPEGQEIHMTMTQRNFLTKLCSFTECLRAWEKPENSL